MTSELPAGTVVEDLVALSRTLGEPARQLAILAEGNTSVRLDGDGPSGRMLVKRAAPGSPGCAATTSWSCA